MNGDTQIFQKSVSTIDAHAGMIFDGCLYVSMAVFMTLNTSFGGTEAEKWITPEHLFWLRTITGSIVAGLGALKLFRSTSYATHLDAKTAEGKQIDPLKPL